jgi:hypothetical protein
MSRGVVTSSARGLSGGAPLVSAGHGATEITYLGSTHSPSVALTLKEHPECHERIDLDNSMPFNTTITRPTRNCHLLESGLTEDSLAELFETSGRKRLKKGQKGSSTSPSGSGACSPGRARWRAQCVDIKRHPSL